MPVEEEVLVIYSGVKGFVDKIPIEDVRQFEQVLRTEFKTAHPEILEQIRSTGTLPDEKELDRCSSDRRFLRRSSDEDQAASSA